MSTEKNRFEADRWLSQAVEDLDAASVLFEAGKYAQACFYAQQSAEKAVKSVGWARWHRCVGSCQCESRG